MIFLIIFCCILIEIDLKIISIFFYLSIKIEMREYD